MGFDELPETEAEKKDMINEASSVETAILSAIREMASASSAINRATRILEGTPQDYVYVDEETEEASENANGAWDELQEALTWAKKALNEIRSDIRYLRSYKIPDD